MTQEEIFNALFNGGNFTRQWLIKISHPTAGNLYYVNNNEDVEYEENIYKAANFDYTPPNKSGEGASLEISATDKYELVEWLENADYNYSLEVVGIINDGEISQIKAYKHFYGTVSMDKDNKLTFSLENDGRLNMVFTVYQYDADLNRGNA